QAGLELTGSDVKESGLVASTGQEIARDQMRSIKGIVKANTGIGLLEANVYHNSLKFHYAARLTGDFESDQAVTVAQLQDLVKVSDTVALRVG
ncbi:hypothetical protein ABTP64_18575, partial [Acinetobacter baumannii]